MGKQKIFGALMALLIVALVTSTINYPQFGFAQVALEQTVHKARPIDASQMKEITDFGVAKATTSQTIRLASGITDPQADIIFLDFDSESTQSFATGYQLEVIIRCQDNADYNKYAAAVGLWDDVEKKFIQSYGTATITNAHEDWAAIFDLSTVPVSSDRYQIVTQLYDIVTLEVQATDFFYLNVTALKKPVIDIVQPSSPHSVKIKWTHQKDGENYRVYRATSATGSYTYLGTVYGSEYQSGLAYECTGLTTGKTYYFKIKSYCSGGATTIYSSASTAKSGVPMPVPRTPKVSSSTYNSVKISWSAAPGANGYYIYRSTSATGTYTKIGITSSTSIIDTGLVTGKTYYYKMKSYHTESNGNRYYSAASAAVSGKPIPALPVIKASLLTQNSFEVTWTGVAGAHGYIIYNIFEGSEGPAVLEELGTATSSARSFIAINQQENKYFDLVVLAYHTENGVRIFSEAKSQSVTVLTMGTPVVTAVLKSSGYIYVEWPYVYHDKYELWRYDYNNPSAGYVLILTTSGTSGITSCSGGNVYPNSSYKYRVRAYTLVGTKKIYTSFGYSQQITPVLRTPTLEMSQTNGGASIEMIWQSIYGTSNYIIERSTDGVNFEKLVVTKDTTNYYESYIDSTLIPGQIYYYRVKGYYLTETYSTPWSNVTSYTRPII